MAEKQLEPIDESDETACMPSPRLATCHRSASLMDRCARNARGEQPRLKYFSRTSNSHVPRNAPAWRWVEVRVDTAEKSLCSQSVPYANTGEQPEYAMFATRIQKLSSKPINGAKSHDRRKYWGNLETTKFGVAIFLTTPAVFK